MKNTVSKILATSVLAAVLSITGTSFAEGFLYPDTSLKGILRGVLHQEVNYEHKERSKLQPKSRNHHYVKKQLLKSRDQRSWSSIIR